MTINFYITVLVNYCINQFYLISYLDFRTLFIFQYYPQDSLVNCVRYQLPALVSRHNVGLVVVDSVAAAFRVEEGSGKVNRTAPLQAMGYRLHHLAASLGLVVVTLNQVCNLHVLFFLCIRHHTGMQL